MGLSRSVSREPGAAPRTSTPATAPRSKMTTVQPVGLRESVKWPTRRLPTSTMLVRGASARAAEAYAMAAAVPINSRRLRLALSTLVHHSQCDMNSFSWRWLAVAIFVLSTTLNYLDRSLLNVLAPLILKEFHLNQLSFGYILSAFSFVYA